MAILLYAMGKGWVNIMPDEVNTEEKCVYCEKPGVLVQVRRMPGKYHLRCIQKAQEAWALTVPKNIFDRIFGGK